MDGIITEIMRFSLKDGPGIRTTVFLKGCNMACKWCHNPETLSMRPQLMHYPELCIGCGACIGVDYATGTSGAAVCPHGAIESAGGAGGIALHRERCVACGACVDKCFSGALVISGTKMSVADVMTEILQDIDYYKNSGGGLTIGGGEPACQSEFMLGLLKAAKEAGIQTAIETNMHADWDIYEKALPYLDLVMLDIKLSDDADHMKWTGTGNANLLANIRKITDIKPTIIRVPVIPGVNDNEAEIGKIAQIAKDLKNIISIELLLYNPLGESKYAALGMDYSFRGQRPQGAGLAGSLQAAAQAAGVPVKIG
ncbi:MAG: glycyl-radical enzyme activating protein [Oscillospiraceae bacterium]|nr:glycyl-radical enzyme activating protein [Oscillospiraceae bacterium]